jgi:hypothetical protein
MGTVWSESQARACFSLAFFSRRVARKSRAQQQLLVIGVAQKAMAPRAIATPLWLQSSAALEVR